MYCSVFVDGLGEDEAWDYLDQLFRYPDRPNERDDTSDRLTDWNIGQDESEDLAYRIQDLEEELRNLRAKYQPEVYATPKQVEYHKKFHSGEFGECKLIH